MDDKKKVKYIIDSVCDGVVHAYETRGHECYMAELRDCSDAYILADKGIERRIAKQIMKRLGLHSEVSYEIKSSTTQYLDACIKVSLLTYYKRRDY